MNVWEIIFLFFALQAGLFSIFFFLKKKEQYANRIFAVFLFCFAFIIVYNTLYWSRLLFTKSFIHLNQLYLIPQSLLAPLLYGYIRAVIDRKRITIKDSWHFLPAAYILLALLPYVLLPATNKLQSLGSRAEALRFLFPSVGAVLALIMMVYVVAIYIRYSKKYIEDIDLKIWLRVIYVSMAICFGSYIIYYAMVYAGRLETSDDYMITAAMAVSVAITAYFGFNQPEVFNGLPITSLVPIVKYSKTGLSDEQSQSMKLKLEEVMIKEKPYLNSEIRLDELAAMLGISRHQTSQIINEHFHCNFFDFINKYRIQWATEQMEQQANSTNMKELAFDSGFNNYVSFYKSFKKYTGTLPTDYKKSLVTKS